MSLRRQRQQRAAAEQALQQALDACRQSADGAVQPLRRHWPAMLVGSGALAGWLLGRGRPAAAGLAPGVWLGQALGLLPVLLRWNAQLAATNAADAAMAAADTADAADGGDESGPHARAAPAAAAPARQAAERAP
jgi:hypothetical protein